jgi:hypothetical protein
MKGHCKNGHDLSVLGRFANGNCKACDKGAKKRLRKRKNGGLLKPPRPLPGPPKWAIPYILELGDRMDIAHGQELQRLKDESTRLSVLPADCPPPPVRIRWI